MSSILNSILINELHDFRIKKYKSFSFLFIFNTRSVHWKVIRCSIYRFEKAFDTVDHNILFGKLRKICVIDPFQVLLHSYLIGRTQMVKIGNSIFNPISVLSPLSSLIFLIFINDIESIFKFCRFFLCADNFISIEKITQVDQVRDLEQYYSKT